MRWWARCDYEAGERFTLRRPTGPNRAWSVLTQLAPGKDTLTPCSAPGMFQGPAGETITSAGNRLVHSGSDTSRNPLRLASPNPHVWEQEGVRPPSRRQCTSQEARSHSQPGTLRALHLYFDRISCGLSFCVFTLPICLYLSLLSFVSLYSRAKSKALLIRFQIPAKTSTS